MTQHIPLTLTLEQLDAIQYAIARRRERIKECIATLEATGQPNGIKPYRDEEAVLSRCNIEIARACGRAAIAEINRRNATRLQHDHDSTPTWMQGQPLELD